MALKIIKKSQLVALAELLGMRKDWHEPDEQDVTVEVKGVSFDNAGFWPQSYSSGEEFHVVIKQDGEEIATVNLATLFAWATGLED